MTGNADFNSLPDNEKFNVCSLEEFLELKDEKKFNKRFRPHPDSKTLNKDFDLFDKEIFGSNTIKPKSINAGGYFAEDAPIFKHPKDIYTDYVAKSDNKKPSDQALLRRWDFTKIENAQAQIPDVRYRLVSREYDILNHIKLHNKELYRSCLNYKSMPQKEEITSEHIDLFELFHTQIRFNRFVGGYHIENLSYEQKLTIAQNLLNKFAQLHSLEIAHRDLNSENIWLSVDYSITLSGFATAYFPSEQTIGDIRQVLEVTGDLAKDIFPFRNKMTPYQYDVRSLAIFIWHIIHAERLSPESVKRVKNDLETSSEWYATILTSALSDSPFKNAQELLDAFNQAKPETKLDFSFDFTELEKFTHDISHTRAYREDDRFIIETSEKEVYCSNGNLVKAWLNAAPQQNEQKARIVLDWLENIAKLANIAPDYLPRIQEFGIARKSNSLFVISDYIRNGYSWAEIIEKTILTDQEKLSLINKLLQSIEHLHNLGFTHGDLKPENVIITIDDNEYALFLLDILDFSSNGQTKFNTKYSPAFDNPTDGQRDNYAVIKMASELLDLSWDTPSNDHPDISRAIQFENNDTKSGFISLSRFKEALTPKSTIPTIEIFVGARGAFSALTIYPENGEVFIQFEKSKQNDVLVTFIGLGGSLKAFYSVKDKTFTHALTPIERDYISRTDKDKSVLSILIKLKVNHSAVSNLESLSNILHMDDIFTKSINSFIAEHIFSNSKSNVKDVETNTEFETVAVTDNVKNGTDLAEQRPSIQRLWQAILNTETEALPSITASECLQKTENGGCYIPYDGDINPIDKFKRDDVVEAVDRNNDSEKTFVYGNVDLTKSCLNELYLKKIRNNANKIETDTPIFLQSIQNKASYQRRKNALQRILDGESVIKKLSSYFDENCALEANTFDINVDDEDFKRYDQPDKNISLNEAQRQAFQRFISHGPLSLLQGPPGTGKTEFIAAFVHYLFEKQNVNNILLVSQSHEAVNTAAERIRKHCSRLGTDLQIVRFSNREIADSKELEDVFSPNLVGQKRQQLNANKINNIRKMGRAMGLPEDYLKERSELEFDIGVQIRRYEKIVNSSNQNEPSDDDEKRLQKPLEDKIRERAKLLGLSEFSSIEITEILKSLISQLDTKYNIQPSESNQTEKLINLTRDMLETLSNERINYDEFLARSRQLVVGTCVGIGQSHIGIAGNTYDWVIVDEAARSISSELAIAMQSGTRILLVGDHKQLPPLYSEEHKNALARRLGISKRGEELDQILGSDFERVFQSEYGKQTSATLKTQYRMAPAIGSLISACFYNNALENGKQDDEVPDIYYDVPVLQASVTWLDTTNALSPYHEQAKNGSLSNKAEAEAIIDLLVKLDKSETFMESDIVQKNLQTNNQVIGVICMYSEQKKLIRKKFNERIWSDKFRDLVKIDSVDSYQGKENRIIILSLTRYDNSYKTGFLYLPNRINVALSRAMDKLVIVGAKALWENPANQNTPLGTVLQYIQNRVDTKKYSLTACKHIGRKK